MHRLLLIAAVVAVAAGCTKPCEELGNRICECTPTGGTTETCKQQVSNVIKDADPSKDEEALCSDYLDSCVAPDGVDFCDWIATGAGKVACGLAY